MRRLNDEELEKVSKYAYDMGSGTVPIWYFNQIQIELLLRVLDELKKR